jgi:hypothetical protein
MSEPQDEELQWLRDAQARRVMPMIGPLLDAWDGVPNDVKGMMEEHCGQLGKWLNNIEQAMCLDDIGDADGQ